LKVDKKKTTKHNTTANVRCKLRTTEPNKHFKVTGPQNSLWNLLTVWL